MTKFGDIYQNLILSLVGKGSDGGSGGGGGGTQTFTMTKKTRTMDFPKDFFFVHEFDLEQGDCQVHDARVGNILSTTLCGSVFDHKGAYQGYAEWYLDPDERVHVYLIGINTPDGNRRYIGGICSFKAKFLYGYPESGKFILTPPKKYPYYMWGQISRFGYYYNETTSPEDMDMTFNFEIPMNYNDDNHVLQVCKFAITLDTKFYSSDVITYQTVVS